MKTILSHANLIDCVEPKLRPDAAVLIEDGRIRAILPSGEADSAGGDAQVIDLKGGYLMPGLWDVHIHPVGRGTAVTLVLPRGFPAREADDGAVSTDLPRGAST